MSEREIEFAALPKESYPRHIAVIMDGNGRWAQRQGLPRAEGHRQGAETVRNLIDECLRLGLENLTLYCLSSENWKRPREELDFLMELLEKCLIDERDNILEKNIQAVVIGRREGLPERVLAEIDKTVELCRANTGLKVCLAINYGARAEVIDAVRRVVEDIQAGKLRPESLSEELFGDYLYTAGMPDPDLLIRTAGEMRLSNFLLWQISYAEVWVTQHTWPEFDEELLHEALVDYARRNRKYGGLAEDRGQRAEDRG